MCFMDNMATCVTETTPFSDRMANILNSGALSLMISIGHRTHLFDTMAQLEPATSERIADIANLNERYVREWLGAMVTGHIVDYNPDTNCYHLPPEHAQHLTRAASPNNAAAATQFIPMLAQVEDKILNCFKNGGGVSYSEYARFQEVMADESDQTVRAALIDDILPLAPHVVEQLEKGIDVLDIGCGSGRALNLLASTFPNSRFTGYDISAEGIERARIEADHLGCDNVQFHVVDAALMIDIERYDLIVVFDAIHDQAMPQHVLDNIHRALKPDGTFLMQDISGTSHVDEDVNHPMGPLLYTISCLHCMTVSLAQGGAGLGAMWGRELAEKMLAQAGFQNVCVHELEHDPMNLFYVVKK